MNRIGLKVSKATLVTLALVFISCRFPPQENKVTPTVSNTPSEIRPNVSEQNREIVPKSNNARAGKIQLGDLIKKLRAEIQGNPVAFNAKYSDTQFTFTCRFRALTEEQDGGYLLHAGELEFCAFDKSEYSSLVKLRAGDEVTVAGTPYFQSPFIAFINCKIVE